MNAYAPQIDRKGSPFLNTGLARWEGDLALFNQPDVLVLYAGDGADVPTLKTGIISLLPRFGEVNPFLLEFRDLQAVNIRTGNATITKEKVRIICRQHKCVPNEYYGVTITVREQGKISYQQRPYVNYQPTDLPGAVPHPECVANCQQRAQWIVDEINSDNYRIATATLVQEDTEWGVDIELLAPGAQATYATVGFTAADQLVPASRENYTARMFRNWYGKGYIPAAVADNKVYTVAECVYREYIKEDNFSSSSNASLHGKFFTRLTFLLVVFDADNANSAAALTEFKSIVNYEKPAQQYQSRLISTEGNPSVAYPFTVIRTDAGDVAAYNAAKTAYSTVNTVRFDRVAYDGVKSYYVMVSKANSQPAAIGSDDVDAGSYGEDNLPCLDCI